MVGEKLKAGNQTPKIAVCGLTVSFEGQAAVKNLSLQIKEREILSIIGPSNSGKTSFLKTLNRMHDLCPTFSLEGTLWLDGKDIYREIDVLLLRKRIGMVFALPLPLPMSIFDNVAYGPRLHGLRDKTQIEKLVEKCLKASYLWEEVKDRLPTPAFHLSGGQQQRLCISRTLAVEPEVILYDEPCSGLDPISTAKVEEAMRELKRNYTQILVTNNTKQAARVSDRTAFFLMGELVEVGETSDVFTKPQDKRTDDYIAGRFG
jgi:phosphate transport system ATP-binding protein